MIVGAMSGFFVVPMNALLQHRGHVLLSAGHSIAVQNFNENVSVLLMLCLYALLIKLNVSVGVVVTYHPAYLLRNPSAKRQAWEDLLRVRGLLRR